jgi:hypothetical protein
MAEAPRGQNRRKLKIPAGRNRYYLLPVGQELTGDERGRNVLWNDARLCLYCKAIDCYIGQ